MRDDETTGLIDEGEARRQLNAILEPIEALPSALLVPLRERLLAKHATARVPEGAVDEADRHRANFGLGRWFIAFRDDEVERRLWWIGPRIGLLAARGDVDPEALLDAAELMYEVAGMGVLLTAEQGLVLDALRSAAAPLTPAEVADAVSARGLGLTDDDAARLLAEVRAALDAPGRAPYVIEAAGRWRCERV